jgi:hypothetical protein
MLIVDVLIILWMLACASPAHGQSIKDEDSYCNYVEQQARAQAILSESPTATTGITPAEGTVPQQFIGVTDSINNVRKAHEIDAIGIKTCQLYRDSTRVQQRIQYDMPNLEQQALSNKLVLIDMALIETNVLIEQNDKMLAAHNLPRQSVYLLEKQKLALEIERQDTTTAFAAIVVPPMSEDSLTLMARSELESNVGAIAAQNKLAKMGDWDVQGSVGVEKPLMPFMAPVQPYVGFTATYNLGSHRADKHLDASAVAYGDWKAAQVGDVMQNVKTLHATVLEAIGAQQVALITLQRENTQIGETLAKIGDSDTSTALVFRNQLTADQIALRVQIEDTEYRLAGLKQYLANNF